MQVTHLDGNNLSLRYLTIVGAYVIKGSRHDTTTLVDLAVVDPVTRSLVLRAGGTDTRHGNTTLIDQERETREASAASFDTATGQRRSLLADLLPDRPVRAAFRLLKPIDDARGHSWTRRSSPVFVLHRSTPETRALLTLTIPFVRSRSERTHSTESHIDPNDRSQ